MFTDILTFFRGFLTGLVVGVTVSIGGLGLGLYWLLDPERRLTPLSRGQRPKSGGEGPPASDPSSWPFTLRTFLERSLEPDLELDVCLPVTKTLQNPLSDTSATHRTSQHPSPNVTGKEDTVYVSPTLDVSWANVLLARFFLMLRESELYKKKTASKMNAKMNAKVQNNSLLQSVLVLDIDLGDHAPKALGIRLIKGISSDYAVLCEIDIVYEGGASIALEATIAGGIRLPVRIYLNDFAGKARVRWPSYQWSDMLGMAFVEDPGVSFTIDAPLSAKTSETVRGMVNRLLESIARKLFLEMWVLPSWRTFYMPLVNPSLEEQQIRKVKSAATLGTSTSLRSTLASKAATLWESRAPLLKFRNTYDLDLFVTHEFMFTTDTVIEDLDPTDFDSMQDIICTSFLDIASSQVAVSSTSSANLNGVSAVPDPKSDNARDSKATTDSDMLEGDTPTASSKWKLFKRKPGIEVYKQIIAVDEKKTEIVKSVIDVDCDANRVFSVLSNPDHFRHVTETFVDSQALQQIDNVKSVRRLRFQLGRGKRSATVFHVKKPISDSSFVVVYRSVHFKSLTEDQGRDNVGAEVDDTSSVGGYDSDAGSMDGTTSFLQRNSKEDLLGSVKPRHRRRSLHSLKDESVAESGPNSWQSSPTQDSKKHHRIQSESGLLNKESYAASFQGNTSHKNSPVKLRGRQRSDSGGKLLDVTSQSEVPALSFFLFGYLIECNQSDSAKSRVTMLSSVGSNLAKVINTITFPSKLKDFIEELVTLTATLSSHDLRELMEMQRPDYRGGRVEKLKSYIGATANYLMKSYGKGGKPLTEGGEQSDSDSPSVVERNDDGTLTSIANQGYLASQPEPFKGEEYVERELNLREIIRVPLIYSKSAIALEPTMVDLTWEFSTRQELPIFYGIEFKPKDQSQAELLKGHYDETATGCFAVIPLCQVSAYAKPICGKLLITHFPPGAFEFVYDNFSPTKRAVRQLATRAWIQESPLKPSPSPLSSLDLVPRPFSEYHADITIARKSFFKISFVVDSKMKSFLDPSSRLILSWTLWTGGYDVNFVIFYEEEDVLPIIRSSQGLNKEETKKPLLGDAAINPDPTSVISKPTRSNNSDLAHVSEIPPVLPPRPSPDSRKSAEMGATLSSDTSPSKSLPATSKLAQYLGKAKEVVQRSSPVGALSGSTSPKVDGGGLQQRAKAALSSRLQAVVSKSEDVSRRLKEAYVEARRGGTDPLVSTEDLSPPSSFSLSPHSLALLPCTKVNTKTGEPFRGSLDLTGKWGCYTLVVDNTAAVLATRTVSMSAMIGYQ